VSHADVAPGPTFLGTDPTFLGSDPTFLGSGPGFLLCGAVACLFAVSTIVLVVIMVKRAGKADDRG
jgi:hypothetical protein